MGNLEKYKIRERILKFKLSLFSLIFSILFLLFLFSFNFLTFDYYTHLLFSSHYKTNWFSSYIYKVGIINLVTYPPLTHQMIALLSFLFPLEISYKIILSIFLIIFSFYFSKFMFSYLRIEKKIEKKYFWILYLFVFSSSSTLINLFVFGQLSSLVSFSFGFISLYFFSKFLNEKKTVSLILSSLSFALCSFSNVLIFLIFSIFYVFLFIFNFQFLIKNLKSFSVFLLLSFLLPLSIYYPFLTLMSKSSLIPTKEIYHWSRYPFLSEINFKRWIFMYGISLPFIILPIFLFSFKHKNKRKFIEIYIISFFFFLLSLGTSTPLIYIFGKYAKWLVYERFSTISSISFLGLFLLFFFSQKNLNFEFVKKIIPTFFILYLAINLDTLFHAHILFFQHPTTYPNYSIREKETKFVLSFLNNVSENVRYQTFGYGRPIGQIYFYSKLPTLDTDYFTGRTISWIRNSGCDEIDQCKNKTFIEEFLQKARNYSVKYIITFSYPYSEILSEFNWTKKLEKRFDNHSVIIWENPYPVQEVSFPEERLSFINYLRGVIPILSFIFFIIFLLYDKNYVRK